MSTPLPSQTGDVPQKDVYTRITDKIIAAIEAGAGDWKMPWHSTGDGSVRPVNAASGKAYRGVNIIVLWSTAMELGYDSNQWATYKQWNELGAQVRKGEKSTLVVFWKFRDKDEETDAESDGTEDAKSDRPGHRLVLVRGYNVFNATQVDGYKCPALPPIPVTQRIETAERFFAATGIQLSHGGNQAFFQPSTDRVRMPKFEAFPNPLDYYSTLSHEATHWTGAKSRLDRDLTGRFKSEAYAAEELVAELGAAFLCADLGLANEPRPDHAAYVANWLKVLKEDSRAIFTAASKAQQAADYLHGLQPPEPMAAPQRGLADLLPQQRLDAKPQNLP